MPNPAPDTLTDQTQAFWEFALTHYARPGVEQACLCLQDSYQGNVNLALLLHWLDTQAQALPADALPALLAALTDTDALLSHFRQLRRELKPGLAPAAYRKLLDFELALEKRQHRDLLAALARSCPVPHPAANQPNPQPPNLANYARQLGLPDTLLNQLRGAASEGR